MTATEVLQSSKEFTEDFVKKLSDKSVEQSKRQVFFMDNHTKVQGCMGALNKVINAVKDAEESVTDADLEAMNNAKAIMDTLQKAITGFQQELMIAETVQEDDLEQVPAFTQENLEQAAQNNDTTQSIVKDVGSIIKNQGIAYNHCLVCDGKIHMFSANNKEELNKNINDIAATGNFKNVALYEMSFRQIPLHTKTILSV